MERESMFFTRKRSRECFVLRILAEESLNKNVSHVTLSRIAVTEMFHVKHFNETRFQILIVSRETMNYETK